MTKAVGKGDETSLDSVTETAKAGRLVPTMKTWLVATLSVLTLATYLPAFSTPAGAQAQTPDAPQLKPDVPKFDNTPPPQPRMIRGGVQHRELSGHESSKKLSSGVLDVFNKKKKAKLNAQTAKVDNNAMLKSGANNNSTALSSTIQDGIGIIGVKFLLSFGRMPVINRVFPGTPAFTMGLHAKDVIVAVDGVPTLGLSKEDVYGMIVGKPDTEVTISIKRGAEFTAKTLKRMDFNDIPDPIVRQDYLMSI